MNRKTVIYFILLFSVVSCEDLWLDLRSMEFVIDEKISINGAVNTTTIFIDKRIDKSSLLNELDIDPNATIHEARIKGIRLSFVPSGQNPAEKIKFILNTDLHPAAKLLIGEKTLKVDDFKLDNTVTITSKKWYIPDIKLNVVSELNTAFNEVLFEGRSITFFAEGASVPAGQPIIGNIFWSIDLYLRYEECRLVPLGVEGKGPCK